MTTTIPTTSPMPRCPPPPPVGVAEPHPGEAATTRPVRAWLEEQGVEAHTPLYGAAMARDAERRHYWRVAATLHAAAEWDDYGPEAASVAALLADYVGVGGASHGGARGAGTDRIPPFQALGSGRKQARDGGAWDAAAEVALRGQLMKYGATIHPAADGVLVEVQGDKTWVPWPPWAARVALEAGRMTLGMPSAVGKLVGLVVAGTPRRWAELAGKLRLEALDEAEAPEQEQEPAEAPEQEQEPAEVERFLRRWEVSPALADIGPELAAVEAALRR